MNKEIVINGQDCAALFPQHGASVSYKKIHGANGGTMLDGSTIEDVVAVKAVIDLNFIPQTEETMAAFLARLYSADYATVRYFDPLVGDYREIEAIYSEIQVQHLFKNINEQQVWHMNSLTLTER